jgi:poly(3-hydroxybutyrate) depolymerase/sugar lactone lactonase YvrE
MKRYLTLFVLAVPPVLTALLGVISRLAAAEPMTWKLTVDGIERTALVYPGREATTTPSPLVFVFHPFRGRAAEMAHLTRIAEAWPEATVVYPQALPHPSPFGGGDVLMWQEFPGDFEDGDVRFVEALLKELSAAYRVDERQVFATGFDNGGAFTYLLLTVRPERFAAFAPVAGIAWALKWAQVPRPVLITQGLYDDVVPPFLSEWMRSDARRLNGCGSDTSGWAPGAVSYQPCTSGQPVVWSVHDGEHVWPSSATDTIVRFFKEHPLPAPPALPSASDPPADVDLHGLVAGTGRASFSGDGGPATAAELRGPEGVAVDREGNLLILDSRNNRVRRVGADGIIRTVAGSGEIGAFRPPEPDGIRATRARFTRPQAIVADPVGGFFIADSYYGEVRRVSPDGTIHTVARETWASLPLLGLAVDREGSLFVADPTDHRVRKLSPEGIVTTVAGTGMVGFSGDGGPATEARLNAPRGLAMDAEGNLFIADAANHRVRKVASDGTIMTVAGTGAAGFAGDEAVAAIASPLNQPTGVAVDTRGSLFIVDLLNYRVRQVGKDGLMHTVFGGGTGSSAAPVPRYYPAGIAVDRQGNLLIADPRHHRIWKVPGVAAPGLLAGQPFP